MNPLVILALALGLIGLFCLRGAAGAWRRRRRATGLFLFLFGLVLLLQALAAVLILVGTRGYRALTRETLAATVTTESTGPQTFRATFRFPDGESREYDLAGDQLYVDAHLLKWRPLVNVLGLHTEYELDRVVGRYVRLEDEREHPRTVHSLGRERPFDFFHVARAVPLFDPLVDAEYGSASFVPAAQGGRFELRVSTSGLLFREIE